MCDLVLTLTSAHNIAITMEPQQAAISPDGSASLVPPGRQTVFSSSPSVASGSAVSVPLYREEEIIGHMELIFPRAGTFEDGDIGPLRAFATITAEMIRAREIELRKAAKRASRLTARIMDRIDRAFPNLLGRGAPLPRWAAR